MIDKTAGAGDKRGMNDAIVIATFYHLTALPDCAALQPQWKQRMVLLAVRGTILVTPEGVNATVAGRRDGVDALLAFLRADERLRVMTHKESYAAENPFQRAKVKLKRETIPLGVDIDPAQVGTYVAPKDWNALISRPEVVVVDTRNSYETGIGFFQGAQDPGTRTFKELPDWLENNLPADRDAPVAMYCTGGIRCEKSTAYLKMQGYRNVYHLEGGILKYLEDVPAADSLWQGACYVFDDRVAVRHDLSPATEYQVCARCNAPVIAAEVRRGAGDMVCDACQGKGVVGRLNSGALAGVNATDSV